MSSPESQLTEDHPMYMNNFSNRLPVAGGLSWEEIQREVDAGNWRQFGWNHRVSQLRAGQLDMPFQALTQGKKQEEDTEYRNSSLFMSQTPREFYAAIDQALADTGVTTQQLDSLVGQPDKLHELHVLIQPAFDRLLAQGYSHADLAQ